MTITDSEILTVTQQYDAEIKDLEKRIDHIKLKKEALHDLMYSAKRITPKSDQPPISGLGKYAGLEATPAIIAILGESSTPLTVSEICHILQHEGYATTSKHWRTAVHTACIRLEGKGRIRKDQKDGQKAYAKI